MWPSKEFSPTTAAEDGRTGCRLPWVNRSTLTHRQTRAGGKGLSEGLGKRVGSRSWLADREKKVNFEGLLRGEKLRPEGETPKQTLYGSPPEMAWGQPHHTRKDR